MVDRLHSFWVECPVLQSFLYKNLWNFISPQQNCDEGINTVLLDIPCWNTSCPGSVFRVLESPVTKKKKPPHQNFTVPLDTSYFHITSHPAASFWAATPCPWGFFIIIMLHMQKNVWPSTSDAMPHSHGLQGEAISPSLCFLALADRDSLFNFIDQTKDKTTIITYI